MQATWPINVCLSQWLHAYMPTYLPASRSRLTWTLVWLVTQVILGFVAVLVPAIPTISASAATTIRTACTAAAVFMTVLVFLVTAFQDHATSEVASLRSSIESLQALQVDLAGMQQMENLPPESIETVSKLKRDVDKMMPVYKDALHTTRQHYKVPPSIKDHAE